MSNRKAKLPSHFCEWVVGTTIESVIGAIPQNKPPKKRDVVRVEVTTDDESEEDTVKITYPRTGRTYTPPPPANEAKTEAKKVRFDFRQNGPIKSAMKQTTTATPMVDSSDEASESGPETESDSSQSAYISSSDATDSDIDYSVECVKHQKQRKKKRRQSQAEEDAESDWDSDPAPNCPCGRCTKGRQILKRVGRKRSKEITPPSPETSDSDEEEEPPNTKRQSGKNKRRCLKKAKPAEPDPDTSDSDSESEILALKKRSQTKNQGKQTDGKKQQTAPQPPMTKKQRKAMNKKAKQQQEQEVEGETSDSPKEAEEETEPEEEPKKQNKGKQKNNKKQKGKQAKQKTQESENEANKDQEAAPADEAPEAPKDTNQGKFRTMKGKAKAQPKQKDGVKKGNYPEGLPVPHMRPPQFVEPIRAQVVQIERVIKTPQDPTPNAYYNAEHNILRAYDGLAYGNHQSNALYPERDAFGRPLPIGQPHPMQNPFYYGYNNPQQYPNYPQMPPFHQGYTGAPPPPDAYSHVPITQGMGPPPWYAMGPPPGVPPSGYYGHRSPVANKNTPVSKAEKNNVGPPGTLTGQENPYYKRKSQNNGWESHRSVPTENGQPTGSDKAGSNGSNGSNGWNKNNDQGAGWNDGPTDNKDQDAWAASAPDNNQNGNAWDASNSQAVDDWNNKTTPDSKPEDCSLPQPTGEGDQNQNDSGEGSNHSKKSGEHWGEDTFPGAWGGEQQTTSSVGQGADNNVGIWAPTDINGSVHGYRKGDGDGNQKPPDRDNVMPGTWVDAPGVTVPEWGDASAAQDTNGQAVHW
ncbi:uncharacterized protein FSUBG_3183 [Fusarium subglutinans]|uniref:Uncharacterized protein n=1 Tax=Gibberella subglutinans TaxID=42677 RepID=A0A8H5Q9S2_GIBSU|nr:uncharacterized protein FSUBG_3183 [Fusarium subglutinans]KAF5610567.1 hypothetical protein FSUBG_3183 [Fusarium subglutinans]